MLAHMPNLQEFKALAAALPPSERVSSSEVADVVGAIAAYVAHGGGIMAAAKEGGNAVALFIHDEIAKLAEKNGDPQPQKGVALTNPTQAPANVQTANSIDYDALAAAMIKAQAAANAAPQPVDDVDEVEPVHGAVL